MIDSAQGQRATRLAILALLFNALTWGVSWLPFRWLEARGLSSLWATSMIFLLGTLVLLISTAVRSMTATKTNPSGVAASPSITPGVRPDGSPSGLPQAGAVLGLVGLALASGLTNAAFNWAVTAGTVVRVVLLFYLMPIWAILLARWLLQEPITRTAVLRIGLALIGAIIVLWHPELGLPLPQTLPDWLAIVGGMGFALTNVLLRRLAHVPSNTRALTMFGGTWVFVTVAAVVASSHGLMAWPTTGVSIWLLGALLMSVVFIASNLALQYGAARLPANVTAVVMLSEVLFASVSALLFGDESLNMSLVIGGSLIVLAAWLASRE